MPEVITRGEAQLKNLRFYFTGKPCCRGHIALRRFNGTCGVCVECWKIIYGNSRERNREFHNSWGKRNPEKRKQSQDQYLLRHPARRKATSLAWYKRNKEKQRIYQRVLKKRRRETDSEYRFKTALRGRIRKAIRRDLGVKAGATTEQLTGCTVADLRSHLESQFTDGMVWENYGHGTGKWNIDHIKPCAAFNLTESEQQRACFHFSNLRPLWHDLNVAKGCHYVS